MNNKLGALVVGAVIALPGAALAAGPMVYGKVNVALDYVDTETDADTYPAADTRQWELNSYASRLGVKGDFDLEVGGLKAIYQAEYEINVDNGARSNAADNDDVPFSQRDIFAGLKGGFGALQAGKFNTPFKTAEGKVDQFNDLPGDIDSFVAGQARADNIIQYTSPVLADTITVRIAVAPGEGENVDNNNSDDNGVADSVYASVVFEQDGLYLAVARAEDASNAQSDVVADLLDRVAMTRLVAMYAADAFEVGALYQVTDDVTPGLDNKDTSMMVSAAFMVDRFKLKAQYGVVEGDVTDREATMMGVGVDYKLAKASKAYVYATSLSIEPTDDENQMAGIGLEHKF